MLKGQIECSQHGNSVTRLDLASVPNLAHGDVNAINRVKHARVAVLGAAEQIALAHDLYFKLLHHWLPTDGFPL